MITDSSELPGVVAVHAQGLAAPELAVVGWIARARVLYWGDLDSHGLRILGLVRQVLPSTESLLMNRETLTSFAALAGPEPAPFRGDISYLTPEVRHAQGLAAARSAAGAGAHPVAPRPARWVATPLG